jgi:hypothetical protein
MNTPPSAPLPEPHSDPAPTTARVELHFVPKLPSGQKYAMRRRAAYRYYKLLRQHCAFLLEQAVTQEPMGRYEAAKLLRITLCDFRRLNAFVTENRPACEAALATQDWTEIEAIVIGPGESEANPSRYSQLQKYLAAHCVVTVAPRLATEPPATPVSLAKPPPAAVPGTVPPPPPTPSPAADPAVPAPPASAPTPPRRLTLDEVRQMYRELEYWIQLGMIAAEVFTAEGIHRIWAAQTKGKK